MSALVDIRAKGVFREPQFVDLGLAHVPFDRLTGHDAVEEPILAAVRAGSSAAIIGARGGGKSSVLAWVCRQLPDDHVAIRVPVVGMNDPSDPAVLGSVALGAALEAARAHDVDMSGGEQDVIERARADAVTRRPGSTSAGAKIGGGPIPAEVSTQLESLEIEYHRGDQPVDRLYGLDRLIGIFTYHGRVPVLVIEDTEAALGSGVADDARDRFFTNSLKLLVREVETPTIIAVQEQFTALDAYAQLRPHLFEATHSAAGSRDRERAANDPGAPARDLRNRCSAGRADRRRDAAHACGALRRDRRQPSTRVRRTGGRGGGRGGQRCDPPGAGSRPSRRRGLARPLRIDDARPEAAEGRAPTRRRRGERGRRGTSCALRCSCARRRA